jgi:hypothetical protein
MGLIMMNLIRKDSMRSMQQHLLEDSGKVDIERGGGWKV